LKNLFNELNLIKSTLIYTQRELNSTKEQLEISKLRYNSGITSQREVINSQREATTALTKYNQAIYEYNILIDRLKRLTGLDANKNCTQNNKIKTFKVDNLGLDFCDLKFNF
jgi:OMF family outer membrane factor